MPLLKIDHMADRFTVSRGKASAVFTDPAKPSECGGLYDPEQVQDDEYDGNNDQNMNPISGAWEI